MVKKFEISEHGALNLNYPNIATLISDKLFAYSTYIFLQKFFLVT